MKIKWLGHACFLIESNNIKIVTDPYDSKFGQLPDGLSANIVTVSHQHYDHNNITAVSGSPKIIDAVGNFSENGIEIIGVETFHDSVSGAERGENIVFVIEAEGIRVAHLGDLGHILDATQIAQLGHIDVLMIPVGGTYTIDAEMAVKVVNQIKPKYILPMHYKTDQAAALPILGVDDFVSKMTVPVEKVAELMISEEKMAVDNQKIILFA